MKIAYFLDVSDNYFGGAANVLIQQAHIMKLLHKVLVVLPCDEQGNFNKEHEKRCFRLGLNYAVVPFSAAYCMRDTDILSVIEHKDEMKAFIYKNDFELLHSVQLNPTVELAARELGIPHIMNIYQIRAAEFKISYWGIYPRYQSSDSELFCRVWEEGIGCISKCIRPSIALCEGNRSVVNKSVICVGMAGSVCKEKNQLTAIKLIERCLAEKWEIKLFIAGYDTSPYANMCQQYIKQHNLDENVIIMGFTSNIEEDLLSKIDVFLCTSNSESFPSSIVEAVTKKIPIISVPIAGVPELFRNRENAYISKENSVEALWESIQNYVSDCKSGKISEIIKNAETIYYNHFTESVVRRRLSNYYDFIAGDNNISDKRKKITIDEILEFIRPIYNKVLDNQNKFKNLTRIYKHIWYYSFLNMILGPGRAYIWGAGKLGEQTVEVVKVLWEKIEIIHFIDEQKQGTYHDIEIVSSDEADFGQVDYVFLAFASGRDHVIDWLEEMGMKYNETVFVLP